MSAPSGKPRGRARGRGRAQPTETARRPGEPEKPPQAPPMGVAPMAAAPTAPPAGSRVMHRGGARGAPRPGDIVAGVQQLTEQVGEMRIGAAAEGSFGRGARRGRPEEFVVVTRPEHISDKKGTSGQPIRLKSNYFKLVTYPNRNVYQYHVDFSPTIESSRMRRALLFDHKEIMGNCFIFDGMSDLKMPKKLEHEVTDLFSQRRTDGEMIKITLKRVRELAPRDPELLRLCNTQMRRNLHHLKYHQIQRYFYDQNEVSAVPQHNLELWPGLITAIHQHDMGVMMVVDTTFKVLRKETVLDIMAQLQQRRSQNFVDDCNREIVGSIVMTRYNNRTYRADDIDWNKNPRHTFSTRAGEVSYVDYYKKQYDITIRDERQPLLVSRPSKRDLKVGRTDNIYLIPELCTMTGLTDAMRSDFNVMKDLAVHTRVPPEKRVQNLTRFMQKLKRNQDIQQEMGSWGLSFEDEPTDIGARILPGESIFQKNFKYLPDPKTADFSREMRGKSMHVAVGLENWIVICPDREQARCQDFLQNLARVCPPMGMNFNSPHVVNLPGDKNDLYLGALRNHVKPDTQLALCIVPNNRKDRYDAIKKMCCIDLGVPSQVVVSRTLAKKQMLMSVATKIGIQLNCKMGGEPWALEVPLKKVMVVGIDTYHDSARKGQSAAGLVASLNNTFTRWYSQVAFHSTQQELGDALYPHLYKALVQYNEINKGLPDIILIYRDGVGDGQVGHVQQWEIPQVRDVFAKIGEDYNPRLGFIIVSKRISTRFFRPVGQGYDNPPPGTVVDNDVTKPERYDFFLVSQSVRQGTVAPTQYNIICDTTRLKPEHMQRLAYKLTHMYFNWPGTIRVPAPCQYAHKLAFLTGQSLHKEASPALSSILYYL